MRQESQKISLLHGLWINDWRYNLRILTILMAAEVLMAYSPFGFIILPRISVTTLFMGVLAAALWGGPFSGAVVGLVFGLTSMWKASVTAVNYSDLIFSPVRSGDPFGSIVLALGPRVLFGIIAGFAYYVILKVIPRNNKARLPVLLIASAVLERVHSMLTYLFMDQVFHVEGVYAMKAWTHLFSANRIQNYLITMAIVLCAYLIYDRFLSRKYYEQFTQIKDIASNLNPKYTVLFLLTILVLGLTATHLWDRIQIILFDIDQFQPELTNVGLIAQVINQFIVAALSALYIVIVLYRHARNVEEIERTKVMIQLEKEKEKAEFMELLAMKDPLTGVYNRKGMEKMVFNEHLDCLPTGFLLIDIDHFKEINDNFGHDAGDAVLKETARMLVDFFGETSVFRFGGDEFAVIIGNGRLCTEEEQQEKWNAMIQYFAQMHKALSNQLSEDMPVTFSAGVCYSENGYYEKMYPLADRALYETKRSGRAGCTMVDPQGKVMKKWKAPDSRK